MPRIIDKDKLHTICYGNPVNTGFDKNNESQNILTSPEFVDPKNEIFPYCVHVRNTLKSHVFI